MHENETFEKKSLKQFKADNPEWRALPAIAFIFATPSGKFL
jgi:hypothetical protein